MEEVGSNQINKTNQSDVFWDRILKQKYLMFSLFYTENKFSYRITSNQVFQLSFSEFSSSLLLIFLNLTFKEWNDILKDFKRLKKRK